VRVNNTVGNGDTEMYKLKPLKYNFSKISEKDLCDRCKMPFGVYSNNELPER
jgi:hypothetical protein